MVDLNLLTIFIAVTTVAVLIQTGIVTGVYFVSAKLTRQVDTALDATRNLLGPLQNTVENLKTTTGRIAEFSSNTRQRWHRPAA